MDHGAGSRGHRCIRVFDRTKEVILNADAFRTLYEYHFTANRKIWESCIAALPQVQFVELFDYSVGSVRNQVVHLMNIDDRWFSGLRGVDVPPFADYGLWGDRDRIRAEWDRVESDMRAFLAAITDDMLLHPAGTVEEMPLWQVLQHVINHGTDHRAQMLTLLHRLGVQTFGQDFVFFLWDRM